jgi:HemY protein
VRALTWTVVLAVLAVAAALLAQFNHGNVVFLVPPYRIELSLNLFLGLAAVLLLAVYWAARLAQKLADFPARVAMYRQRREEVGGQRALREALRALFEGRFSRAERAARAAQESPALAGLAALIGARAAHRLQEHERRDEWLEKSEGDRELATARLVTSAEMWAEGRENARSLSALDDLRESGARHIHATRIGLAAYAQAGRWLDVLRGVRLLSKRKALHDVAAARYKQRAYRELLQQQRHDAAALEQTWNGIPAEDRRAADIALQGARLLMLAGRGRAASAALEEALAQNWDARLLDEYARAPSLPTRERIERAEGWLQQHPEDPALLRCLGLLCLSGQLWGKARHYLEDSLRKDVHPSTLLALARLAEITGNEEEAAAHYREAALAFEKLRSDAGAPVVLPARESAV